MRQHCITVEAVGQKGKYYTFSLSKLDHLYSFFLWQSQAWRECIKWPALTFPHNFHLTIFSFQERLGQVKSGPDAEAAALQPLGGQGGPGGDGGGGEEGGPEGSGGKGRQEEVWPLFQQDFKKWFTVSTDFLKESLFKDQKINDGLSRVMVE